MINTQETPQITKIYLVTNCYGDPNKVYIGKTKSCRNNKHQQKYGKDIHYCYIDEVNSLNSKDWKPLECFWIEYFRQLGFDIQNKNEGGGGVLYVTENTRQKISQSNKGKLKPKFFGENLSILRKGTIRSQESIHKMVTKLNKPVVQVDISGNIVGYFDSIIKASKSTGILTASISDCLSGKIPSTSKDKFRFFYTKNINEFKPLTFRYKVYYNNTVKEYNSINSMKNDGITQRTIYNCLKNKDGIYNLYKIIENK